MHLFRAELRRTARRRLSLVFGILALGGLLLLTGLMWFTSSTGPGEAELAEAQAMADEANAEYAECAADERYFEERPDYDWVAEDPVYEAMPHEEVCGEFFWSDAQAEDFIYVYTFLFEREGVMLLIGIGIVTGLLSMLLAASAIGAEWSSGGMANLLVWHPNRMRVWGAKLASALVLCAAAVVVTLTLAFALLYLTAAVRGDVGDLDARWWEHTLAQLGRTIVLALGMTVLGAALAMLGRHTAIAGGVVVGYLTVGELLVTFVRFGVGDSVKYPDLLSLYTWIGAWLRGRMRLEHLAPATGATESLELTSTHAGLFLGSIVLVFAGLATWSFAKRDTA
jgi:ABC-2 type transport system permease protein